MSRVQKKVARWAGAFLLLFCSSFYSSAQTPEQVTGNLITSGANHTWTGITTGSMAMACPPGGGACSGGPGAMYDPATNTIHFSFSQSTAAQTFAVNQALSNAGAGILIQGYNYTWDINNQNFDNRQGGVDTLTARVLTYAPDNITVRRTDSWTYSSKFDWTTFSGSVNYINPGSPSSFGNLKVEFTGMDSGFWGGYFGPQVRNVGIGLKYTVDPCLTNPAYSPSCPGYADVIVSGNLLTGTTGPQAYAINQALAAAGAGATIHGFDYGYKYNVSGRQCSFIDLFGLCITGWQYSDAGVSTVITDGAGSTLYSSSETYNGGDNGKSGTHLKKFRFSSSLPMSTLGGFAMHPWTSGNASITDMHSSAVYTADPCVTNPLSSPSCTGYAEAYFTQQCTANPLYDSQCPGYAQAYFTQQCTANPLYNNACPGYATAYLNYQCSVNPLYATQCTGYEQAYFDQQCSISGLHSTRCPNYETAYKSQQCSLNALYATDCPGYEQAYFNQQCSINPLYSTGCAGYAAAYFTQQCNLDGLYSRDCPNYSTAYAKKSLLEQQNTSTSTSTSTSTQVSQVSKTEASPTISSDGTVKAEVSKTGDSNVDKAIASPTTTTNTAAAPAAAVQLAPKQENKPETSKVMAAAPAGKDEKKEQKEQKQDGKPENGGPTQSAKAESSDKDKPKTAREEIQERREAAAKAKAVEEGKKLAENMGQVATMEQQIAVQNVVLQAMAFTPGFDTYHKVIMPDGIGYKPFEIYRGQTNVDNRLLSRGLYGPSDRLHETMVSEQYK
jgi:hypothetical protein